MASYLTLLVLAALRYWPVSAYITTSQLWIEFAGHVSGLFWLVWPVLSGVVWRATSGWVRTLESVETTVK